jgi:hypothetical protein
VKVGYLNRTLVKSSGDYMVCRKGDFGLGVIYTYFQNGYPSDDPTTLLGMPSASRITERSCDPRPRSIRHIFVDSGFTGTPSHSSSKAVLTISSAFDVRSAASCGEMSLNFSGKVPDWLTKVELGPIISGDSQ